MQLGHQVSHLVIELQRMEFMVYRAKDTELIEGCKRKRKKVYTITMQESCMLVLLVYQGKNGS